MSDRANVTVLLKRLAAGDTTVEDELVPLIYGELKRLASSYMRNERPGHTLQPTALVNEAYIRLAAQATDWESRAHFFSVAAKMMRRILVDHARQRKTEKRGGGGMTVELYDGLAVADEKMSILPELDQALDRLAAMDVRQAKIVEMRYFAGLTEEEIALVLKLSTRTVKRDWRMAKTWLKAELSA